MLPWSVATVDIEGGKGAKGPMAARMFGNGAKEYGEKYGSTKEHLAKIGMLFKRFRVRLLIFMPKL
jgi:hypothetical protein